VNATDSSSPEGLAAVLARLASRRVLLITGPSRRHVERLTPAFAGIELDVFAEARRHVPQDLLAQALQRLDAFQADTVVALGGGSAIGFGKALRLQREFRFVAIPTTYAGSERTTLWGTTQDGQKTTGRDPRVLPDAVIHDVELTVEMPKALTVTSLMNALAHPLSALGSGSLTGDAREQALTAITVVYGAIEALVRAPSDRRARREAARGAGLAATALEAGKPGPHHALVHRLGGRFDLDHSGLHSVLLPHSLRRLRDETPALVDELSARLNVADVEDSLFEFLMRAGAATSLRALGVSLDGLVGLLDEAPELPRALLRAAFHGRRPSGATRLEDWGLAEPVSVRGPQPEAARRVIVALHGRGAAADSILARAVEIVGNDPTVCVVAPQATDNVWYTGRYNLSRDTLGAPLLQSIADIEGLLTRVIERSAAERVVLFGFSQGACLAIEVTARLARPIAGVVALSGASIGLRDEQTAAGPGIAGMPVLLGSSQEDPYIAGGDLPQAAARLSAGGAIVTVESVPGNGHGLHGRHRLAARVLLSGRPASEGATGFGNVHQSEDLPDALPRDQNSPRRVAYGLYAEQVNGSGFVAPRHENRRSWLYRVRPSADQSPAVALPQGFLAGDFLAEPPEPNLAGWAPLPLPTVATDFVDGLATLGGAGSARLRRGYAVHVYAANRGMEDRCFGNADGDLLILPEQGALTLLTELGPLEVAPGQVALVPRGIRFSVLVSVGGARGYVAESFGRPFGLPDRGPVGANGLADARHFRAPSAWHEDRVSLGYRVTAKLAGRLFESTQDHSPFDVAAWQGNHVPTVYDLDAFSPVGNARFDHGDPSIHTVLSAPMDEQGAHTLDLVAFVARWDVTEHTFRPPYFHRNVTTELNGIVRDAVVPGSPFVPGCFFLTPSLVPHGVVAASVERHLAEAAAESPRRSSESSLWFQFETALPFVPTPWARDAAHRIADWPLVWGAYRKHFRERA